jgi:murein DD-endopeptidase MepM/ murein hydrolase activator NlpD
MKMKILSTIAALIGIFVMLYAYTPLIKKNSIEIKINSPDKYFSRYNNIDIDISDKNAPIRSIYIRIVSMGTPLDIYSKVFTSKTTNNYHVSFKTNKIIPEGDATMIIDVVDYSKNNFMNGFEKVVKKNIVVDSKKPKITLLSGINRIRITGSALAIYYVKEPHLKDIYLGVSHDGTIDKFKAYDASSLFDQNGIYMSFFTYPLSENKDYSTDIYATDKAGNTAISHIRVFYSGIKQKESKINISDDFIKNKVLTIMKNENIPLKESLLDDFLYVNNDIRTKNTQHIKKICSNSENTILWRGRFSQFYNSKVTATFADKRVYYYNDAPVDTKFHMGYDLASTKHAKVNAANNGKVIFEGYLGVYGNTLIIDHGFGLFSLYGHLSDYLVKIGEVVSKNQYIAMTDTTGLAGGDHLHFDILVNGYYANPIEWWDGHWIKTHIESKIEEARTRLSLIE